MNIRQLRYISAVAHHDLNVSAAADSLYTSQPGVSKQIRQLEDELGVQVFERNGRQLTRITPAGEAIIELAERALIEVDTIKEAALEFSDPTLGNLAIAASHTQARYALPPVIKQFVNRYPRVTIQLYQGTPMQIAELTMEGKVDLAIATEAMEHFEDLVMFPCYRWNRTVIVPRGHPLCGIHPLSIEALAEHPIATYVFGFTGRSKLDVAFKKAGRKPNVVFTATDADIIKTYVRAGIGVGIIARLAVDEEKDSDLCALDANHLFEASTTKIGFRRATFLRGYTYDFIELFAPHLRRELIDTAVKLRTRAAVDPLFVDVDLPVY
ncbi:MAG TPA: HTH-type transcriptional regulator CysB [Gammaproteobacteria bacterium]|jgi:LysR family cys regulon transcriptional activator